jgi:hypothetical protein
MAMSLRSKGKASGAAGSILGKMHDEYGKKTGQRVFAMPENEQNKKQRKTLSPTPGAASTSHGFKFPSRG